MSLCAKDFLGLQTASFFREVFLTVVLTEILAAKQVSQKVSGIHGVKQLLWKGEPENLVMTHVHGTRGTWKAVVGASLVSSTPMLYSSISSSPQVATKGR